MWRGLVRWFLTGHYFTVGKRAEAINGGIHSGNAVGVGVVRYVIGGGCYDVKELVHASGGMLLTVIMGRFVVALDG